jgi:galactoside O-acetyltransferase
LDSFLTVKELREMNFKKIGTNVLISRKTSIYGAENISIGNNVRIDDFCILSGVINIGDYVHIAAYVALYAGDKGIELNDFAGVSSKTTIYAITDDYLGEAMTNPTVPIELRKIYGGPVILEKHVLIGASTVILPNLRISEGAAVGACSLITKDCMEWSIYAGVPAKKVKDRSKNILQLEKSINR